MKFSTQQLPSGKWGIYSGECLLATVDCQSTCETILANLVSGRRDAPDNDVNELYQAHQLRHEKAAAEKAALESKSASPAAEPSDAQPGDAQSSIQSSAQKGESVDNGAEAPAVATQPAAVKASKKKKKTASTASKTKRKATSAKRARKSEQRSQATPASA